MNARGNSGFQVAVALSAALHLAVLVLPGPAGASLISGTPPAPRLSARLLASPSVSAAPALPANAPTPRLAVARPSGIAPHPPMPRLAAPSVAPTASAAPAAASASSTEPAAPPAPAAPPVEGTLPTVAAASQAGIGQAGDSEAAFDVPPEHRADYLDNAKPSYPKFARDRGQQGRVLLAVRVGVDGRPLTVRLERSSGYPLLDAAAQDAVERWRFVPARRGQTPVEAWAQVPIAFGLAQP